MDGKKLSRRRRFGRSSRGRVSSSRTGFESGRTTDSRGGSVQFESGRTSRIMRLFECGMPIRTLQGRASLLEAYQGRLGLETFIGLSLFINSFILFWALLGVRFGPLLF